MITWKHDVIQQTGSTVLTSGSWDMLASTKTDRQIPRTAPLLGGVMNLSEWSALATTTHRKRLTPAADVGLLFVHWIFVPMALFSGPFNGLKGAFGPVFTCLRVSLCVRTITFELPDVCTAYSCHVCSPSHCLGHVQRLVCRSKFTIKEEGVAKMITATSNWVFFLVFWRCLSLGALEAVSSLNCPASRSLNVSILYCGFLWGCHRILSGIRPSYPAWPNCLDVPWPTCQCACVASPKRGRNRG